MKNPFKQGGRLDYWARSILLLVTLFVFGQSGALVILFAGEGQQESAGATALGNTTDEATSIFYFPQIANGTAENIRLQTTLIFINTGPDTPVQLEFLDSQGPLEMELTTGTGSPTLNGSSSVFNFQLKKGESLAARTPGTGDLVVGYAKVTAAAGVGGTAIFRRSDDPSGIALYEAGVPATTPLKSFSVFLDSLGNRDTGLALVNPLQQLTANDPAQVEAADVTLRVYTKDFELVATTSQELGIGAHSSRFIWEFFQSDAALEARLREMEGLVTVESNQPLAAVTLRQNDDPELDFPEDVPTLAAFPVTAQAPPPSFILLLTDDQAWDAHSLLEPLVQTPHLESLAQSGIYFPNGFVSTSICPASRASILTGLYFPAHRLTFLRLLDPSVVATSWPVRLRQKGYRLSFLGKNGARLSGDQLDLLFDEWESYPREYFVEEEDSSGRKTHLTDLLASRAVEFLERQTPETPFALVLWFHAPHATNGDADDFPPPQRYEKLYDNVVFPPRPGSDPALWADRPQFLDKSLNREYGDLWWTELYQQNSRNYHSMIRGIDDAVGAIRAALARSNLDQQTVIFFLSDNGYYRGERRFAGKWLGHEVSIRVPFIIYDPRRNSRTAEELVLNVDIAPTVLELAQLPVPDSIQGRSLVPLLENKPSAWRSDFFVEHTYNPDVLSAEIHRFRGVRTTRWKYLGYLDHDYEELYDLDADPHELKNLAQDPSNASLKEALRARTEELYLLYAGENSLDTTETTQTEDGQNTKP